MKKLVLFLLVAVVCLGVPTLVRGESACGDVNESGLVDLSDAVYLLNWLFLGGAEPVCAVDQSCANVNADDKVDLSDAVYLLNWLFLGGPVPECPGGSQVIQGFTFIGDNAQGYPEYTHDQTGIVFVRLPGGTFNMGSPDDEMHHWDHESPIHKVTLSPFLIAKYELTQAQWEEAMGENPSYFDGTKDSDDNPVNPSVNRDSLPVEQVSWDDIQVFEERTKLTLPTEAQWEYACRAGTETAFYFGSGESCEDWICGVCEERDAFMWYCGNSGRRTREIGSKPANQFGLHDLHGNVWEWCEDWFRVDFYAESIDTTDPLCTNPGSMGRAYRGGSWLGIAGRCRSADRAGLSPDHRSSGLGFRPSAPSP